MFKLKMKNCVTFRHIQWIRIQTANYFQYIFHVTLKIVAFAISANLFQTIIFMFNYFLEHEMPFKSSLSATYNIHKRVKVFRALFHTTL